MDAAVPARLRAAADPDLPPPRRPRDGRHGGADPDQGRPRRERRGAREGARRQAARGAATATTAPGSRTRASSPSRARSSTQHMTGPEPARPRRARTCASTARRPARACPTGTRTEDGPAPQHPRRRPVPRGLAARHRLRAALQPDGRRGDRRDLAHAGLAVDPPRRARSTTAAPSTARARPRACSTRRWRASQPSVGAERFDAGPLRPTRASSSSELVDRDRASRSS